MTYLKTFKNHQSPILSRERVVVVIYAENEQKSKFAQGYPGHNVNRTDSRK